MSKFLWGLTREICEYKTRAKITTYTATNENFENKEIYWSLYLEGKLAEVFMKKSEIFKRNRFYISMVDQEHAHL